MPAIISSRIFLIGLMGSGKSYWGRQLAAHFHIPFLDLDKGIEMAERISIAEIFAAKGEGYFREVESKILQVLAQQQKYIMSCGGGTPCFYNNMQYMKNKGKVIWLNPPLATVAERLMPGRSKRPLLHSTENEADIIRVLQAQLETRKMYYEAADYVITDINPTFETFEKLLMYA